MVKRLSLASPQLFPKIGYDISAVHKRAIEGAIRWAWSNLISSNEQVVWSGNEEAITSAIEFQLGRRSKSRRIAPGLTDFDHIPRGAKVTTADGRIEKQPDLVFRPPISSYRGITNTTHWGCFVECKLIENGHATRTVASYCYEGVRRFASGEYAASMASGMMVAYVRGNIYPVQCLEKMLPLYGAFAIKTGPDDSFCSTHHPRGMLSNPCMDVTVTHLWLLTPS